jgi:hypothetical protein
MCHTINFKGRLELDYPTITLTDLLLQKIQIVKLTENDVKDIILLFLEHDVGDIDKEVINARFISTLFSKDWGFYHTATTNLNRIKHLLPTQDGLSEEDQKVVAIKIDDLLRLVINEPKSKRWKIRARIGTRKKWYNDVEEPILPGTILDNSI